MGLRHCIYKATNVVLTVFIFPAACYVKWIIFEISSQVLAKSELIKSNWYPTPAPTGFFVCDRTETIIKTNEFVPSPTCVLSHAEAFKSCGLLLLFGQFCNGLLLRFQPQGCTRLASSFPLNPVWIYCICFTALLYFPISECCVGLHNVCIMSVMQRQRFSRREPVLRFRVTLKFKHGCCNMSVT